MSISELPPHLYAEAVELWHEAGLTRPWNDAGADLRRAMHGSSSTVLACLRDGRLVGTAMVGHDGHRGWVYYLAVAEGDRGTGVGRELMKACEAWVSARGVPKLQLMVRTGNDSVRSFYDRLGYELNDVVVLGRRIDG